MADIVANGMNQADLVTLLGRLTDLAVELKADSVLNNASMANVKTVLGDIALSPAGLAIGTTSTAQIQNTSAITYLSDGAFKSKGANSHFAFTADVHDIADGSEAVFLLSLDSGGTGTITKGTEVIGTVVAAVPDCPAGETAVGHVLIEASGAIFNATTDNLSDGHLTDTYIDTSHLPQNIGDPAPAAASTTPSLIGL